MPVVRARKPNPRHLCQCKACGLAGKVVPQSTYSAHKSPAWHGYRPVEEIARLPAVASDEVRARVAQQHADHPEGETGRCPGIERDQRPFRDFPGQAALHAQDRLLRIDREHATVHSSDTATASTTWPDIDFLPDLPHPLVLPRSVLRRPEATPQCPAPPAQIECRLQ